MSTSPPEDAYRSLADILIRRDPAEVLEIEILSPGLGPILRDGIFIGITKKILVQAFLIARQVFFEKLVHMDGDDFLSMFKQSQDDLSVATEVILLFDCEHITACNWRKRRLNVLLQHDRNGSQDHRHFVQQALLRERSLMTTYLCSPLHRHTKSPTLWHHRLWTMRQMMAVQYAIPIVETTVSPHFNEELCQTTSLELGVVLRAGELHPKNYYAFSYMRQLLCAVSRLLSGKPADSHCDTNPQLISSHLANIVVEPTLKWCLAHPKDISGWTFLYYGLCNVVSIDYLGRHLSQQSDVLNQVIHFAVNIANWEGESLWTFVDMMVTKFGQEILPLSVRRKLAEHAARVPWETMKYDLRERDGIQHESENHAMGSILRPAKGWSRTKQLILTSAKFTQ